MFVLVCGSPPWLCVAWGRPGVRLCPELRTACPAARFREPSRWPPPAKQAVCHEACCSRLCGFGSEVLSIVEQDPLHFGQVAVEGGTPRVHLRVNLLCSFFVLGE